MVAVPVPPPDSTTSGYRVPCTRNFTPPSSALIVRRGALEDPDELPADDLALGLRVGDAGQRVQEAVGGVDGDQLDPGGGDVVPLDLLPLPRPQQAVVDEHAGQLVADGPVHQRGGHRGVDPAGQPADHLLVADRRPDGRRPARAGSRSGSSPGRSRRRRAGTGAAPPGRTAECTTSGWYCTPASRRATFSNAAIGVSAVVAVTANPAGAWETASPWLIQTPSVPGRSVQQRRAPGR